MNPARETRGPSPRIAAIAASLCVAMSAALGGQAPERVTITVASDRAVGPMTTMWAWFGYDEPNYTYTSNGKKLLSELAATTSTPVYVRTHNLLTSGDGVASLKWGSTNAYTEDANGRPRYDW